MENNEFLQNKTMSLRNLKLFTLRSLCTVYWS